ncbi:ras-related and estrogen-regulated growth inhibitor [Aplysia californica]|uniref:small monomeric GTPase n=1 Tax=Aplysia californica TaxID=6500 RepID=A0ABM1A0Z8_APLCA|nr:ras-related and estrogen-regulated growth inhibitor [Aplysia californica]
MYKVRSKMKAATMNLRINVLGARGVGKSAIAVRYLTKRFIGEYSSGLDISYQTTYTSGDGPVKVDILDTSCQDDCQASCHDVYDADAFVVVYSVTDTDSFAEARRQLDNIRSQSQACAPVLLMGNKLDLDHARKVFPSEVEQVAEENSCQHTEVSAAECHVLIVNSLHSLIADTVSALRHRGRSVKRRRSLFENVSRKLGSVFRRKSFDDSSPTMKKKILRFAHNNRHSV